MGGGAALVNEIHSMGGFVMRDGFIKVAAGTPEIRVADCAHNAQACAALLRQAGAARVVALTLARSRK